MLLAFRRGGVSSRLPAAKLSCAGGRAEVLVWWKERIGRSGCRRIVIATRKKEQTNLYFRFCFKRLLSSL